MKKEGSHLLQGAQLQVALADLKLIIADMPEESTRLAVIAHMLCNKWHTNEHYEYIKEVLQVYAQSIRAED